MSDRQPASVIQLHKLDDALLDLLVQRATDGLDAHENDRLNQAGLEQVDELDLAAAAMDLALFTPCPANELEPSDELLAKLDRAADAFIAQQQNVSTHRTHNAPKPTTAIDNPAVIYRVSTAGYLGWAAAALLAVVASIGWLRSPMQDAPVSAQALYTSLTNSSSPGLVQADWGAINADAHPGFAGVSGEIVFDPQTQQGVMRFVGLPENVPQDAQYQLWIVDPTRDTQPVDGGVFDAAYADNQGLDQEDELYVLVNAKLLTEQPQAFVITIEHPGGVVESEEANYRLIAAPAPAPGN